MSQWSKDSPNFGPRHWYWVLYIFPPSPLLALIRPPVYPMDLLSFGALRASSARRSTGSIDAFGGDSSGLGVPSGSVGTVAAAILVVDGERAWTPSPFGEWYGRFLPAGSRARSGVTGTLLSLSPQASHLCPGLRPNLRSGLRPGGSGPGLRACARAAPRIPGDAGPEARRWGGTRWHCPARAVTSLFHFALSQGFFAKGENLRPSSSLEMAHVSHSWNNHVWKLRLGNGRPYGDVGIMVALIYQQCRGAEGVKLSFYDLKVVWLKHPVNFSCVCFSSFIFYRHKTQCKHPFTTSKSHVSKYLECCKPITKNNRNLWLTLSFEVIRIESGLSVSTEVKQEFFIHRCECKCPDTIHTLSYSRSQTWM